MDARIVPALERLLQSTNELHKVQAGLGEELLKEVGDKISGAVSGAAGEEMRSMGEAIKESVRSLNEAAQAMRDGQSKLVEVTSAIIGQMNESFGDNSKRLSEETEKAVRTVVEQIRRRRRRVLRQDRWRQPGSGRRASHHVHQSAEGRGGVSANRQEHRGDGSAIRWPRHQRLRRDHRHCECACSAENHRRAAPGGGGSHGDIDQ